MELVNEFRVPLPVEKAWELLTAPERIAPCMPGAQLLSVDGEDFHGAVKVKVGPIVAQYKGKATFQVKDPVAHHAVIKADGKESRGQGNASALVTMRLTPDGDATAVALTTDLTISGKAAQFGRGVLADVSAKLVAQFVRNLEADILAAGETAPAADDVAVQQAPSAAGAPVVGQATAEAPAEARRPVEVPVAETPLTDKPLAETPQAPVTVAAKAPPTASPDAAGSAAAPVSLLGVVAWPLLKRSLPVLGALVIGVLVWLVVRASAK
ncbi:SRPBCC family protein [Frankia sp. CNm7]|uniref:SRPBCC family protein n=1 Tax=Frankia nepalensis TaxID=1836974 RepID=A0A937RER3_9ACTN|nr:SRPBCC family protein [Frankia nepalensis]MBL7496526.1 SRPBCC family protein [Frankia nepalensis]MBL7508745.1 SRPBCC family protein [Frankia nepalensis]MBL7523792.1 SRPBCC family protein [Frankia nepalensis]MBL7627499.1 SRPBCC family protein [Frankia nepalensis]